MIRNIFKSLFLSSVLMVTVTSCEMTLYPNDAIPSDKSWETLKDAQRFRVGMYSKFRAQNGGLYTYTSDQQSDLFNATISYGNRGGEMQRWDFTASQYDIEDLWERNYYSITDCNNILNNIDKIVPKDDKESAELKNIKGEAYLMRAICYHTLVTRFCKDFEPSSASSDVGLPLVVVFDPDAKPSRATLAETYALIKSDIAEARTLMTVAGKENSIYLTKDVVDLFEARVDLYMHNYANAVTLAKSVSTKYPLVTTTESLTSMWLNDQSTEIIFKVFQSLDERANPMPLYLNYNTGNKNFAPDFVPSKWVLDLYDDSDIRKSVYYRNDVITANSTTVNDVYMLNKYPGNPALKKSEAEYFQMPKVFRSAEAYLIGAEAAYQAKNESEALVLLNSLRTKRGASSLTSTGSQLFTDIKNEWIREFIGEGKRLDNLKRWKDGMQRRDPQNESILVPGNDFISLKIDANNIRFVWEIPNNDLNANPNLVPNWK